MNNMNLRLTGKKKLKINNLNNFFFRRYNLTSTKNQP